MPPKVALILCIVMVVVLLRIERQRNQAASLALWVPIFWVLIVGSRPVGSWFGTSSVSDAAGSPLDRLVLNTLILLALWILSRRNIDWSRILKDNFWLILLYLYLGSSILWSDFPYVSLKRWIKISGQILMAIVVMSEQSPLQAMESVFRRCAYVLIPLSLVLVKYFPHLGRQYGRWCGGEMWVGVAGQKNGLGLLCAISLFFLIWAALRQWRSGEFLKSRSQAFADALIVGIALFLLLGPGGSYSATSIAILIVGIASLMILYRMKNFAMGMAAHLKAALIAFLLICLLIGNLLLPTVSSILGREETLTGRTDIWQLVLEVASHNPILGVGFGGFWGLEDDVTSEHGVKQSHNGYLEVYLQVGIVGIVALFAFLMEFCGKVRREVNYMFDWGVFGICFLLMLVLYNYSEASFIQAGFMWTITVFLTVVFSAPCLHTNGD